MKLLAPLSGAASDPASADDDDLEREGARCSAESDGRSWEPLEFDQTLQQVRAYFRSRAFVGETERGV